MAIADRYFSDDEELVHVARRRGTAIAGEFSMLFLIVAGVGTALSFLPWEGDRSLTAGVGVVAVGLLAAPILWFVPMLKWLTTVDVLTNRRLMVRDGNIFEQGRDMSLIRVNDVSFTISPWERIMRYGTLSIQSASEREGMVLQRVPEPQWFPSEIYRQVNAAQRPEFPSGPQG